MDVYHCRICEKDFDEIPETAIRLGGNGAYKLYKFPSGEFHDLRKIEIGSPIESIPESKVVTPEPVKAIISAPEVEPEPELEPEPEPEEVWTPAFEEVWYSGYATRLDQFYLAAKLEGADSGDDRYKVYVHHSSVAERFGAARIGMKIKFRIAPNRKDSGGFPWEALEAVLEIEEEK
jgi:hypothetical protein